MMSIKVCSVIFAILTLFTYDPVDTNKEVQGVTEVAEAVSEVVLEGASQLEVTMLGMVQEDSKTVGIKRIKDTMILKAKGQLKGIFSLKIFT